MIKQCFKCNIKQPIENFYSHKQMSDGHVNKCKTCNKNDVQENYKNNIEHYRAYDKKRLHKPDRVEARKKLNEKYKIETPEKLREYKAKWRKQNPLIVRSFGAKRRAKKLKASPSWADLERIKDFYKACPEGYTVDHIIPLQGELVCGLHVENNLQYLTSSQNSSKRNKFEPEFSFPQGK